MSTLTLELPAIDPPELLPVQYLSTSSLNLYERCPMAWKARYIDKLGERPSGKMTLGKVTHAALAQHYAQQLETGSGMSTEELLDEYATDWSGRAGREDIDWQDAAPGELKDKGAQALAVYHREIAPDVVPVAVEREFELRWDDAPFLLTGWIDLETAAGAIADFKTSDKRWSEDRAAGELSPTVYLAARRAEGNPASAFEYHVLVKAKQPTAQIVATERSERQLDLLTYRVFSIARSIEWRWTHDVWQGAGPDAAWLCRRCGYASECPWRRAA